MPWGDNPSPPPFLLADPTNGGTGYQSWLSSEEGNTSTVGFFNGPPFAGNGSGGNVNPIVGVQSANTHAFGMYGQGTNNFARAFRPFASSLMVGGEAVVRIGLNYRNGAKGVFFKTTSDSPFANKFGFQIANNNAQYYTRSTDTWTNIPSLGYTPDGQCFHITFQRITSTTATAIVQLLPSGPGSAITVNLNSSDGNLAIDQVEFFCGSTDASPNNENNLYFNFLSAFNAWR